MHPQELLLGCCHMLSPGGWVKNDYWQEKQPSLGSDHQAHRALCRLSQPRPWASLPLFSVPSSCQDSPPQAVPPLLSPSPCPQPPLCAEFSNLNEQVSRILFSPSLCLSQKVKVPRNGSVSVERQGRDEETRGRAQGLSLWGGFAVSRPRSHWWRRLSGALWKVLL